MSCPACHYDAFIFGIGPAATVCAIQMAQFGRKALLVPPSNWVHSSERQWGETLAPRGEFLLSELGLARECLAGQFSTDRVLSCWFKSEIQVTDLAFDPHGLMWQLNRVSLDRRLLECATRAGVSVLDLTSREATELRRRGDQWELSYVRSGSVHIVYADYVVDATGKPSRIARLMGARRIRRDPLIAIFGICERKAKLLPLLVEPVKNGWWYSMGFPDGRLLVAFVTDPNLVRISGECRRTAWRAMLEDAQHTKGRCEGFDGPLAVVSAEASCLDRMSGEGWAAIGDAAMSFDPLSSHGLCSAIEQAVEYAQVLEACGSRAVTLDFEESRKSQFERYATQRAAYYKAVRRFSGYPFWEQRNASAQ